MNEFYVNEPNRMMYPVYVQGQPMPALDFKATLRAGTDPENMHAQPGIELDTDQDAVGEYNFIVPSSVLKNNRMAKVDIEYNLGKDYGIVSDVIYSDIVRRYVSYFDVVKLLGEEFAIDYDTYGYVERDVRALIDAYCGQSFNYWYGSQTLNTSGSGRISLPQHMESLKDVSNRLSIAAQSLTVFHGYDLQDGGMTLVNEDRMKTVKTFGINHVRSGRVIVTGHWGYLQVPTAVRQAAMEMLKANLCDDKEYRNRYIDNIRNENIRIQLRDEAFSGDTTGNAFADDVLAPYRALGWDAI